MSEASTVFSELSSLPVAILGTNMTTREVSAGDTIVKQGEIGDAMYLIVTGEADVVARDTSDNTTRSLGRLGAGDFFGEISLLADKPRIADVVAATPMTIMCLDRRGFDAFMSYSERARTEIGAAAARRATATEQSMATRA
jgi:CRP-like cAMP-binding protein